LFGAVLPLLFLVPRPAPISVSNGKSGSKDSLAGSELGAAAAATKLSSPRWIWNYVSG
jgi:hypothetical protein